ncbi:MAG: hypothetical protein ACT4P5_03400 [Armatimonadota bacterium]
MRAPFLWGEELERKPGVVPPFVLETSRTALIVVDMQNTTAARGYGVERLFQREHGPYGVYYFERIERVVIPNAGRLLGAFRQAGGRVLHLTVGSFLPDGSDFEPLRRATTIAYTGKGARSVESSRRWAPTTTRSSPRSRHDLTRSC